MKKMFVIVLILMVLVATLAGCKEKAKCGFCMEEKWCDTITIWGEEGYICEDCQDKLDEMMDEINKS